MSNKWLNRTIILLISALLLGVIVVENAKTTPNEEQEVIDWGDKANFAGLEVIEQSQYDLIKTMYEPGMQPPRLIYGDAELAYDEEASTFYASTFDSPNTIEEVLSLENPNINAFILENEYRNYQDIIAREAAEFNIIFVEYDKYFEAKLVFTNNVVEILNTDSQSITVDENSNTVTLKKGKSKTKYYQVNVNDNTFSREIISLNLWNLICDATEKKEFEVCELFLDNRACGLYIKTEKEGDSVDLDTYIGKVEKESLADYILLTQIVFAYKNIEEHYALIQKDDKYIIKPNRIKYSLGTYSDSNKYLEYKVFERQISLRDFGVEDEATIAEVDNLVKERYLKLRDNDLSEKSLKNVVDEVFSWVDSSGVVARYGSFDKFREDKEEVYSFLDGRLQKLDEIYGVSETSKIKTIELSDFYLQFSNERLARNCLYKDDRGFVFYIPSFYKEDQAVITFDDEIYDFSFDGKIIKTKDSIVLDNLEHEIVLADKNSGVSLSGKLVFLKSANLPTIFIDTANNTTDYIAIKIANKEEMKNEPGEFLCYDEDGNIDSFGELKKIRCRGNSSFIEEDKLSFQVSFFDPVSVLKMDPASKWVIQGNTLDYSRIRNSIMYYYAKELGMDINMDNEFADVYVNGEYEGNYLISEKPEIAKGRVELDEAGFFVSVINQPRLRTTDYGIKADEIYYRLYFDKEPPNKEERERVASIIENISELLDRPAENTFDVAKSQINVDSFADMYLLNMLANERDANKFSTYYYYKNGLLNAGPVWDYDRAFKNNGSNMQEEYYKNDYPDGLPEKCFAYTEYQDIVTNKWNDELKPIIERSKSEDGEIYKQISTIKPSIIMDYRRYLGIDSSNQAVKEYDENVSFMIDAMNERIALIDEVLSDIESFTKLHDEEKLVTYWNKCD